MRKFLERLIRRKLVQWTVAYVAAAFALLQGIDVIAQRFGWPDAIERILIIALCIGFFVTLLLAWYHGERGAQEVSGAELLLLALLLAIGAGLLWKFSSTGLPRGPVAASASHPEEALPTVAPLAASVSEKSIAVLAFANMSADKDDAYFADGLSEEIINSLSRVPDLRVAARTSSFALRDSKETVPEIAAKLHVAAVLEGSVRRAGDHLRMTAQLIRASDGFDLWSDTYDRSSNDIIFIQEDVARAIAQALKTATDPGALAKMQRAGTRLVPAYDAYLKGLSLRNRASTSADYRFREGAMQAFDEAIALDPGFSDAYNQTVALARANVDPVNVKSSDAALVPYATSMRHFRQRLELASQHARDAAQANLYRALRAWIDLRYAEALRLTEAYLDERPDDSDALEQASKLAYILGDKVLIRKYAEREYALPGNISATSVGMTNMMDLPDRQRSVEMARGALERYPDSADTAYQAQRILLTAGLVKEASMLLPLMLTSHMDKSAKGLVQMRQACAEGRRRDAETIFRSQVLSDPARQFDWHGLLLLGRDDDAAKVLASYDHPDTMYALSNFLIYPKFDVRRFPLLLANLQEQGIKPPPFRPEPYACKPEAATP